MAIARARARDGPRSSDARSIPPRAAPNRRPPSRVRGTRIRACLRAPLRPSARRSDPTKALRCYFSSATPRSASPLAEVPPLARAVTRRAQPSTRPRARPLTQWRTELAARPRSLLARLASFSFATDARYTARFHGSALRLGPKVAPLSSGGAVFLCSRPENGATRTKGRHSLHPRQARRPPSH
jgi:hypothetical protein